MSQIPYSPPTRIVAVVVEVMKMSNLKKRKAVTRDVEPEEIATVSGDEFDFGTLDGTLRDDELSDSETSAADAAVSDDDSDHEDVSSTSETEEDGPDDSGLVEKTDTPDVNSAGSLVTAKHGQETGTEGDRPNYRIEKDANGNDRYVYSEIDPGDDSDYSVPDDEANTIGNIPLSYYDSFPHIGYNINGKKVMRPATGKALDALLNSIEIPKGYTGLTDPNTGKPLELSPEELQLLKKVQLQEVAEDGYNPYEPTVEWFTSQVETMPLSAAPEPKRRFVPSKHEQKRVMKIVKAIREGRIQPYRPPTDVEEDELPNYDIWANEVPRPDHAMHMPAPKLPPPGFDESYHPPPEYLPDDKEKREWEKADEEDREKDFLPADHTALRKVPGYGRFVKEKFERCLDLYLAPRVRHTKLNIDPESLLPKLPNPDDLRPFPSNQATIFRGHEGRVRSVSIDPSGQFLATGGDDGTARVWTIADARQVWSVKFGSDNPVNSVRWRPVKDSLVLAVSAGDYVHFCAPLIPEGLTSEAHTAAQLLLDQGWGNAAASNGSTSNSLIPWQRPTPAQQAKGVTVSVHLGHVAKSLSWHAAGNYLVAVCPSTSVPASRAISIHTVSKHQTQMPFKKRIRGGGTPQTAHFHPTRPVLFVANQRVIRAYDLSQQSLLKIVQPGARWISSFSIHPTSTSISGSDNLLVGSYDRRLLWMDLDLSTRPYKTLRYHPKAIRAVGFHPNVNRYPLFADASDDGTIQVFHGLVTSDMMSNATIVPLKVLKGHKVTAGGLGVMDLSWHPSEPWLASAGADGTARLWTS